MLAYAGLCWPMLAYAGLWWPMMAYAGLWWPMLAYTGLCWPMLAYACICWPMLAYAYKCLHMLAYAGLSLHMLTNACLCLHMQAYTFLWWSVLAYAGLCWPSPPSLSWNIPFSFTFALAHCSTSCYNYPDFNCCDAVINTTASSAATATMTMTRINRIPPKFPFDRSSRCWMIAFKWPHCPVSVLWRVWQLRFEIMQKTISATSHLLTAYFLWFWNFWIKQTPSITLKTQHSTVSIWQTQHNIKTWHSA